MKTNHAAHELKETRGINESVPKNNFFTQPKGWVKPRSLQLLPPPLQHCIDMCKKKQKNQQAFGFSLLPNSCSDYGLTSSLTEKLSERVRSPVECEGARQDTPTTIESALNNNERISKNNTNAHDERK